MRAGAPPLSSPILCHPIPSPTPHHPIASSPAAHPIPISILVPLAWCANLTRALAFTFHPLTPDARTGASVIHSRRHLLGRYLRPMRASATGRRHPSTQRPDELVARRACPCIAMPPPSLGPAADGASMPTPITRWPRTTCAPGHPHHPSSWMTCWRRWTSTSCTMCCPSACTCRRRN
jgi:hypothetical protein